MKVWPRKLSRGRKSICKDAKCRDWLVEAQIHGIRRSSPSRHLCRAISTFRYFLFFVFLQTIFFE